MSIMYQIPYIPCSVRYEAQTSRHFLVFPVLLTSYPPTVPRLPNTQAFFLAAGTCLGLGRPCVAAGAVGEPKKMYLTNPCVAAGTTNNQTHLGIFAVRSPTL